MSQEVISGTIVRAPNQPFFTNDWEAEQAYLEYKRIEEANGGVCLPPHIVDAAKNPESFFHGYMEWNDKKAGHQWRLVQARKIIQAVVVIIQIKGQKIRMRAIQKVQVERQTYTGPSYSDWKEIARERKQRKQIIARLLQKANRFYAEARQYEEFHELCEAILATSQKLGGGLTTRQKKTKKPAKKATKKAKKKPAKKAKKQAPKKGKRKKK